MKRICDSELKVLNPLWEDGPQTASELAKRLLQECGWNRNTTYTVIKKLVQKGLIERQEPNFLCMACVGRKQACRSEIDSLVDRMFQGSKKKFLAIFAESKGLTCQQTEELRALIQKWNERGQ